MDKVSIIVPCYNEEQAVKTFYAEVKRIMDTLPEVATEYFFVDDGSEDGTLKEIKKLHSQNKYVQYISFSRNFGKEAAMYAGLEHATGDYVVIMDVDLQDPPELLPEMYYYVKQQEYDSVATRRVTRIGEPRIRSFFARCFYHIMNKISDVELMDGARDYRFMSRQYVNALLSLKEYNRFSKGLFGWVGFKTKWLEFENRERTVGETKWSFWKLFKYSLEGIVSFSEMPLYLSSIIGACMCGVSLVAIIFIIVRQLLFGGSAFGWPSLACIVIFIGGIQLLSVGILGLYFSKAYLEIKKRPIYIEKEICMEDVHENEKSTDINVNV
ncbi:MAG: glycosyltransferase family 2 protein [Roseburia inulinivorans]